MENENFKSEYEFMRTLINLESEAPRLLLDELTTTSFRLNSILNDLKKYETFYELKLIQVDCGEK